MQLFKIKCTSKIWDMRTLPSESLRKSCGQHGKSLSQKEALELPFLCLERWHVDAAWQTLAQPFPDNPNEEGFIALAGSLLHFSHSRVLDLDFCV